MRYPVSPIIFAISVASCAPAPAAPPTIETKVAEIAKAMNSVTPKSLGDGLSFDGVSAEGELLFFKMSGLPEWKPPVTDAEAAKLLGASICDRPGVQGLVREGARLFIVGSTRTGAPLPRLAICTEFASPSA